MHRHRSRPCIAHHLDWFSLFLAATAKDEFCDIAITKISKKLKSASGVRLYGKIKKEIGDFKINDTVRKYGSSTCGTSGTIKSINCLRRHFDNEKLLLRRTIKTTDMGEKGDSGSLIINDKNQAVGIFIKDKGISSSTFMSLDILKKKIEPYGKNMPEIFFLEFHVDLWRA